MAAADLGALVARLASPDPPTSRAAGDALVEAGPDAVPLLVDALERGDEATRKAASHLLGRLRDRSAVDALIGALGDGAAKVRKNAAVSLGRLGDRRAERAVADALSTEEVQWVRSSLVLALGSLGGEVARATLAQIRPRSDEEGEALRKALDKVRGPTAEPVWRTRERLPAETHAQVPRGLEDLARDEARDARLEATEIVEPGLLRLAGEAAAVDVAPSLRCIHDLRLLLGRISLRRGPLASQLPESIAGLLAGSRLVAEWRSWVDARGPRLRYRFALEGLRLAKPVFRALLQAVRERLQPLGLEDSPSGYSLQLVVEEDDGGLRVWWIPSYPADRRFAYRLADVGAAIDPVIAACLARWVRAPGSRRVLDPTCGSATLLIERVVLDAAVEARGIDVSPTALRAASRNVEAAGLADRIDLVRGDAGEAKPWIAADEVVANLPFGVRSRSQDLDLARLYRGVVAQASRHLGPGGRAVLYTSNRRLLEEALSQPGQRLRVAEERTVASGGLRVGAWLLGRD